MSIGKNLFGAMKDSPENLNYDTEYFYM
jgi:hypothetical protein